MSTKCPRCGSVNCYCLNRGEQIGDCVKKYGSLVAGLVLAACGHPNMGKFIASPPTGSIQKSKYKCESCGHIFTKK